MSKILIKLNNDSVSKASPQFKRDFGILIIIISIIPSVMGFFLLMGFGATLLMSLSIVGGTSVFAILTMVILSKCIYIYPNSIHIMDEHMILINNQRKYYVSYPDIIHFLFSSYSYDYKGKPCPRWIVGWNNKLFTKQIDLTEENAKQLAKILDDKGISYKWDEHVRKRWEDETSWQKNE